MIARVAGDLDGIGVQPPIKAGMTAERREMAIEALAILLLAQMRREAAEQADLSGARSKLPEIHTTKGDSP
ncbi:MAG: hypothetical protein ABR507_09135 [Actinomycetota bacterium]|nr:hypothetical protein [Actinomycetota bacterium]